MFREKQQREGEKVPPGFLLVNTVERSDLIDSRKNLGRRVTSSMTNQTSIFNKVNQNDTVGTLSFSLCGMGITQWYDMAILSSIHRCTDGHAGRRRSTVDGIGEHAEAWAGRDDHSQVGDNHIVANVQLQGIQMISRETDKSRDGLHVAPARDATRNPSLDLLVSCENNYIPRSCTSATTSLPPTLLQSFHPAQAFLCPLMQLTSPPTSANTTIG